MAVAAYQVFTETAAVREDLIPDITIISPEDTPFTSRIGKVSAMQPYHEWLTDTLHARSAVTAQVEGAAFASSTRTPRVRLGNYCEIVKESFTISGTIEASDVVTMGKGEFRYQRDLTRQELANSVEYRCVGLTATAAVSGASGTARQLKALLPWISTNASTAAASAMRTLTLALVNAALQSCWTAGGRPDVIMCGGARKTNLVNIQTSSYGSRNVSGAAGRLEQRIDVFMGEFGGTQEIVLSRDIDVNTYAFLMMSRWKLAWLRRPHIQTMGKEGDRRSAQWLCEYTMEARAENANAKITAVSG